MQMITGSVGEAGANARTDVALVEAMLVKIQRQPPAAIGPYLKSYDGTCTPATIAAIRAFQSDNVAAAPTPAAAAAAGVSGLVAPGDATWVQLVARLPAAFSDLRALAGSAIVYLGATVADRDAKLAKVPDFTFTGAFELKVKACINQMFALHGIALGVCPKGGRRTFQAQYDLLMQATKVTNAGPGESNHNYGMAMDIGFSGLRWLLRDGTIEDKETPWLHKLTAQSAVEADRFWAAQRTVGTSTAVGTFRGPVADKPHLQNWDDATVSMTARLAIHLAKCGKMRWSVNRVNKQSIYSSDLGMGGSLYPVGTAAQIWNRSATVTSADIALARAYFDGHHPAELLRPDGSVSPAHTAAYRHDFPTAETTVFDSATDLARTRDALRAEFEKAEANWQSWTSA